METIKEVLMKRDGMSEADADDLIAVAKMELYFLLDEECLDDAEFCMEWFGLEPDYMMELIY